MMWGKGRNSVRNEVTEGERGNTFNGSPFNGSDKQRCRRYLSFSFFLWDGLQTPRYDRIIRMGSGVDIHTNTGKFYRYIY